MKTIAIIMTLLFLVSCGDGYEYGCPPPGYHIISDGDEYTWCIGDFVYICPVYFDNFADALQDAETYSKAYREHADRYLIPLVWDIVDGDYSADCP